MEIFTKEINLTELTLTGVLDVQAMCNSGEYKVDSCNEEKLHDYLMKRTNDVLHLETCFEVSK